VARDQGQPPAPGSAADCVASAAVVVVGQSLWRPHDSRRRKRRTTSRNHSSAVNGVACYGICSWRPQRSVATVGEDATVTATTTTRMRTSREIAAKGRAVAARILAVTLAGACGEEQEVRLQRAVKPTDAAELATGVGGHPSPLLPT
jgi:hypothetical protein